MLAFEIQPDGGVTISGRARELLELANWLAIAARDGHAEATWVPDEGLSRLTITRVDD